MGTDIAINYCIDIYNINLRGWVKNVINEWRTIY